MSTRASQPNAGALLIAEMKEFAGFDKATQRYIRRSLDVAYGRSDPIETWSRDELESADEDRETAEQVVAVGTTTGDEALTEQVLRLSHQEGAWDVLAAPTRRRHDPEERRSIRPRSARPALSDRASATRTHRPRLPAPP